MLVQYTSSGNAAVQVTADDAVLDIQFSGVTSARAYAGLYCLAKPVFLNRRAAARYRALASITPGRERFSCNLSF